jgi:hypothetical protein
MQLLAQGRSGALGVTIVVMTSLILNGCGLYFHSDDYQKKTDAAADAAEAATVTPRVTAIGNDAIATYDAYEKSIVAREIAIRDNTVVRVIKAPLRLEVLTQSSDGSAVSGLGWLDKVVKANLTDIVGSSAAPVLHYSDAIESDLAGRQAEIASAQSTYADIVNEYATTSLACADMTAAAEAKAKQAGAQLHAVWQACNHGAPFPADAEQTDVYKDAVKAYRQFDTSCKAIVKFAVPGVDPNDDDAMLAAIAAKHGNQISDLYGGCVNLQHAEDKLSALLFGKGAFDPDSRCVNPTAELAGVMCDIVASDAAAATAAAEKKKLDAQIKELEKQYKASKPKGENADDASPSFLDQVAEIQKFLAAASPEAQAYGFDQLAEILKEAVAVDIAGAVAESEGTKSAADAAQKSGAAAPAAPTPGEEKAALAGAVLRVVVSGARFGQAYEKDPPFDRANTAIIALAAMRLEAGKAEIAALTEGKRRKLLSVRLMALARGIQSLDLSRLLIEKAVPDLRTLQAKAASAKRPLVQPDLLSLGKDEQEYADGALSAYVSAVNRGLIPSKLLAYRDGGLDYRKQIMINTLTAQSSDQVVKAAMEALRAYGKGGVDPNLVIGAVLGALAVSGLWVGAL